MIIRTQKTRCYSIIANEAIQRPDLTARAKGLFCYMMSLPDDWQFYKSELHTHFREGRDAMNKAFKELEEAGYVKKRPHRTEDGKVHGWEYVLVETVDEEPEEITENPQPSYWKTVRRKNRQTENPSLQITNNTKDVEEGAPTGNRKKGKHEQTGKPIGLTRYRNLCDKWGKSFVDGYIQKIADWSDAKGRRYKDYAAAAADWINRDLEQGKIGGGGDDLQIAKPLE